MNKHILFVMRSLDNPKLFTQEEKEANKESADAAYITAADAAAYTAAVAYTVDAVDAVDAADAAATAAYITAAADADADADAENWVSKHFKSSGEDKQTYINEVERLKGNNTMHYDEQREEELDDMVNNPPHYTQHPSGVECINITEHYNFNIGNAIKYLWRSDEKHDDAGEDLKKAAWYINRELNRRGYK